MFALSTYNLMATTYAQEINEKCHCTSILRCYMQEQQNIIYVAKIICPDCNCKHPKTVEYMAKKVQSIITVIWK